jgi:hypothetical protein
MQTDIEAQVPSDLQDPFSYNPLPKSHLHFRMVDGIFRVFEPLVETSQSIQSMDGPEAVGSSDSQHLPASKSVPLVDSMLPPGSTSRLSGSTQWLPSQKDIHHTPGV